MAEAQIAPPSAYAKLVRDALVRLRGQFHTVDTVIVEMQRMQTITRETAFAAVNDLIGNFQLYASPDPNKTKAPVTGNTRVGLPR